MRILHVIANPKPIEESVSKTISKAFFDKLKSQEKNVEVNTVDLYEDPPPFYNYNHFRHFWHPVFDEGFEPTDEMKKSVEYAKRHAQLLNSADILAITTPMWNFSSPAILKAWQDQVISPGLAFEMEPTGVKSLHKLKRLVIFISSGGVYGEQNDRDTLTRQIKFTFAFINVKDVDVVWADGQNPLFYTDIEQRKQNAIDQAKELAEKIIQAGVAN